MKTHRQQEEQQRQKAQKAAFAAEMAATIERTTGPVGPQGLLPLDQLSLIKPIKDVDLLDDDVVQQLGGVMAEAEVVDTGLLLDDQASVLLQGDTELWRSCVLLQDSENPQPPASHQETGTACLFCNHFKLPV